MQTIIHSGENGTGMTNFEKSSLPRYQEAMKISGVKHLVISDRPMANCAKREDLYSLHNLDKRKSQEKFWTAFDSLK